MVAKVQGPSTPSKNGHEYNGNFTPFSMSSADSGCCALLHGKSGRWRMYFRSSKHRLRTRSRSTMSSGRMSLRHCTSKQRSSSAWFPAPSSSLSSDASELLSDASLPSPSADVTVARAGTQPNILQNDRFRVVACSSGAVPEPASQRRLAPLAKAGTHIVATEPALQLPSADPPLVRSRSATAAGTGVSTSSCGIGACTCK